MATLAALRRRVTDNLFSSALVERPFVDVLTASYTNVATTVSVSDGGNWARGDIIENSVTGEQMFVLSVSTNDLTVRRAYNGTTAAASDSTDDIMHKNPRFSMRQIDEQINGVLGELQGHGLWGWGTGNVTLVADENAYNVSESDVIDIAAVYYQRSSDNIPVPLPFHFHKNLDSNIVASGTNLDLWDWGEQTAGDTVYYTTMLSLEDPANLLTRQEEIVVNGACARLIGATTAHRTHDPGRFTDRTVQPGQGARDARFFQAEFILAVRREQAMLKVEAKRLPASMVTARSHRWRA